MDVQRRAVLEVRGRVVRVQARPLGEPDHDRGIARLGDHRGDPLVAELERQVLGHVADEVSAQAAAPAARSGRAPPPRAKHERAGALDVVVYVAEPDVELDEGETHRRARYL